MRGPALLALSAVACAACAPATSIEAALVPERTEVHAGEVHAVIPIGPARALVDAEDGLWIVGDVDTEPERVGEPDELGEILAASPLDGATLIAGESAVLLVRGTTLGAAPVAQVLEPGESIAALAVTPRAGAEPDLWISTREGLYLFRDEALAPIELDGHDLADAAIAPSGEGEIWAIAGERLLRIAIEDGEVIASLLEKPLSVQSLASDDRGVPYVVGDGALHAIERDGRLLRFELPSAPRAVRASGIGPDVWVETESGAFHVERRTARPVSMLAGEIVPGLDGEAFVITSSGVDRVRARHLLRIEGLHEGASLVDRTEVTAVTNAPGAALSVTLDGAELPRDEGAPIVLDPTEIPIGAHELEVRASFTDGTLPVRASVRFTVAPTVTWTEHIQPLYAEVCSDCHGAAGPSPTRLDSREAWEANIVRILDNTRTGRMPLGRAPLEPSRIELIDTWSRTGFPE